jgi:hypothetical protein
VRDGGDILEVERGELVLICNFGDGLARIGGGELLVASSDLAGARELPPRSCALVRR